MGEHHLIDNEGLSSAMQPLQEVLGSFMLPFCGINAF